jgi:hypothetical protein
MTGNKNAGNKNPENKNPGNKNPENKNPGNKNSGNKNAGNKLIHIIFSKIENEFSIMNPLNLNRLKIRNRNRNGNGPPPTNYNKNNNKKKKDEIIDRIAKKILNIIIVQTSYLNISPEESEELLKIIKNLIKDKIKALINAEKSKG